MHAHTQLIKLSTGLLTVHSPDPERLHQLVGFGSRANRQRGFVFVSKVLGKHYPSRPAAMTQAHAELAARVAAHLDDGLTLVIGFAETATGLGFGVYEQLCQLGVDGLCYQHTTRYRLQQPLWLDFQEEHSHASEHLLYYPSHAATRLAAVKNLVLVDDEFSTGRTVHNLMTALLPHLPGVRQVVAAGLLDWRPAAPPTPNLAWVSLHRGQFEFSPADQSWPDATAGAVAADPQPLDALLPVNFGRLGISRLTVDFQRLVNPARLQGERVLVLGTGEFMHPPFALARWLADHGVVVYSQASTRSPLNLDAEISHILGFYDNYHENVNNYLYNLQHYDRILVAYETRQAPANHQLIAQLAPYAAAVDVVDFSQLSTN